MRLLIIGASSFLGGHLRRVASGAGIDVVAAGRGVSGVTDVRLDLVMDPVARVADVLATASPDTVVNCAGATSGGIAALSAANVIATQRLLTALVRVPSPPRLVHIGSAAEYGPARPGVPLAETAAACPAGLYGVTKLAGTALVELGRSLGLDAVSLRVFNVVGAGAPAGTLPGDAAGQLRRLAASASGPGTLRLGPLDGVRDFVDARDVADAVLAAAAAASLPHAVVNVGSGAGLSARTLVGLLVEASGQRVTVTETAGAGGFATGSRSPARSWQQADIGRAAGDFGWKPRRGLADAVADLWEGACA